MAVGEGVDVGLGQPARVDFSGQQTAEPTDGIFDAAFLPGRVGVAEVGLHVQMGVQLLVVGELGAVIEGDGLAQRLGQRREVAL